MDAKDIRVGFVGSVMKDPQSPHAHLHAHAMLGPIDTTLPGATFWRRTVVFGGVNWWSVDDLRAEIREETSNNRVKSGYTDRGTAPIDKVPDAGSTSGLPNALDPDPYIDSPAGPPTVSLPPSNAPASRKMSSRPTDSRQPLEAVNSLQLNRMSYDRYDAVDLQSTPAIR
ncbi:hypothetical protein TREMEDRAFT_71367 [Tremella mesenterica DSM 1558]|nr:uncharacterized protein TREMEDRAFT_71367 [Tremella mesenterica DSM 1558]EIW70738.1 hypothetical protein TREMEDRAFT_71367 [Tremella mesenterica DSM 1558]